MIRKNAPSTDVVQYPTADGWHIDAAIPREKLQYEPVFFFGVERWVFHDGGNNPITNDKSGSYFPEYRLNLDCYDPRKLRKLNLIP